MKINPRRFVVLAVLGVLLASAGWWQFVRRDAPQGQRPLATLDASSLAGLRDEFNASTDAARVILLLSPT